MDFRNARRIIVCIILMGTAPLMLQAVPLNVGVTVRDSLSQNAISKIKVMVKELGQSFVTAKSSFYVALEPSTYTFIFEAEGYETAQRKFAVTTEGQSFIAKMIKTSDLTGLNKRTDSLYLYMQGFQYACTHRRITDAYAYMVTCRRFNATDQQMDSMMIIYNETKDLWIDSIFEYAKTLEDSQKISDAYYYYKQILTVDPLHQGAQERLGKTETALTNKIEGKTQPTSSGGKGATPAMTAEQIESMFNQAVSKFIAEDYEGALTLLKTVLKNSPNHEGATNYLARTRARLQIE
jgi:tetratricopeptide (TPR) repeat protein